MTVGEQAPHRGRMAVGVAVHAPARPRDRGVDDLGVGQVGPLRAGEVDLGQARERLLLLAPPALPALEVEGPLVDVVELPVVVPEAHR